MIIVYNIIFIILAILYLPIFILRGKFHKDILQRFAAYPKSIKEKLEGKDVIWVHAVSVGEVNAARPLIEKLKRQYPNHRFVISTVTKTGNNQAKRIASSDDAVIYLPLDLSFIIKKALRMIHPSILILLETEIWPNLIRQAARKNIPIAIVNGRISDRSFPKYMVSRIFVRPFLKDISIFAMQSQKDAQRMEKIGAPPDKIQVSGNLKFDFRIDKKQILEKTEKIRHDLGLQGDMLLFVAGSTHPGEEEQVIWAYKELIKAHPQLRLVIAPRHIERSDSVAKIVEEFGFEPLLFSEASKRRGSRISNQVIILDTIGDLVPVYSIADVVFVGGSLVKKGGHNIIEPAIFAKPILFGPHIFNFKDISSAFIDREAAILVKDKEALLGAVKKLLANRPSAVRFGEEALRTVLENEGAVEKVVSWIAELI